VGADSGQELKSRKQDESHVGSRNSRRLLYFVGMMTNRSVPTDVVLPHLFYTNVTDAIAWLTKVFGFSEHYRYGQPGNVDGAQMRFGKAYFMLARTRDGRATPTQLGQGTQYLTLFVEDVDSHYQRVKAGGAKITEELNETMYGERQFVAADLDGHSWLFSKHVKDVDPTEWGATVAGR
jgi:uncharacterized glyoxalase superfamily protein PhnB